MRGRLDQFPWKRALRITFSTNWDVLATMSKDQWEGLIEPYLVEATSLKSRISYPAWRKTKLTAQMALEQGHIVIGFIWSVVSPGVMEDLADIDETMLRWISEFTIVVESLWIPDGRTWDTKVRQRFSPPIGINHGLQLLISLDLVALPISVNVW